MLTKLYSSNPLTIMIIFRLTTDQPLAN